MRPHQYIKNIFILLPIFFSLQIIDVHLLLHTMLALVAFSSIASATYIFNDYHDIEEDRQHPKKKMRPLASGAVTKYQAVIMMFVLLTFGLLLMGWLSLLAFTVLIAYIALNIAYTLYLKHVAILDIAIVAVGFVLRLFIGAIVANVALSVWIVIMTFLLAMFMALAKRRDDVLIYTKTGKKVRKAINGYNLEFLNISMAIMAAVVIVAYTIYSTSSELIQKLNFHYMYLTSFFVILGIMRYLQITFVKEQSGAPTQIILKDHFIQLTLVGWIVSFAWILYGS